MTLKKISLLLFVLLIFSNYSAAQTQMELNETAYKSYIKSDKELNKEYKKLLTILNSEEKQLLIKSQKDWLKFRDSHCEFETSQYKGGSIQPLIRATCLDDRTKARIKDLKESIKNRNL